jgi:hypothetical protein
MSKVNLTLSYFVTIILLLVSGLMWVFLAYEANILRMVGLLLGVFVCAIVNLTYFLSAFKLWVRLLVPGMICIILFILVNKGSSVERNFFTFFGVLNLLIGFVWFLIKNVKSKAQ